MHGVLDGRDRIFGVKGLVFRTPNVLEIGRPKELDFALVGEQPIVPIGERFVYKKVNKESYFKELPRMHNNKRKLKPNAIATNERKFWATDSAKTKLS